jgi:hypothetical protein
MGVVHHVNAGGGVLRQAQHLSVLMLHISYLRLLVQATHYPEQSYSSFASPIESFPPQSAITSVEVDGDSHASEYTTLVMRDICQVAWHSRVKRLRNISEARKERLWHET